jgi:hypothetical protein
MIHSPDFFEIAKKAWLEMNLPEKDERLWIFIGTLQKAFNEGVNQGEINAYELSINLLNFKKNEKLESIQKEDNIQEPK